MTIDVGTRLRVFEACSATREEAPLISFVFPMKGGGSGQVFLKWLPGKTLKAYLKDPALHGALNVYQACHSRILDQGNIKRRLLYTPREGDEFRFIPGSMR